MGPLADFRGCMAQESRPAAKIKWIDNNEDNKQMLRTNNSEDDLVIKIELDQVTAVVTHRKPAIKSTIKPFQ